MCSVLKRLALFTLVAVAQASHKKSKSSGLTKKFVTAESKSETYQATPAEYNEAWERSTVIGHRNPRIWRLDGNSNIIMSTDFTRNSPISFEVFKETSGKLRDIPQAKLNPKAVPWIFVPLSEHLMNIIEIAIIGYVTGESGPVCWTPSKIHYDFKSSEVYESEQWFSCVQSNPKFGLMGHNEVFKVMGVSIRKLPDSRTTLNAPSVTCFNYVSNFEPLPLPVVPAVALPLDYDSEAEGKTDRVIEFDEQDLAKLDGLTDEEFAAFETKSKESAWSTIGETPKTPKGKTPTGKTSNGKTSSGGFSVASIDDKSSKPSLINGAKIKKPKSSSSLNSSKFSSPSAKKSSY